MGDENRENVRLPEDERFCLKWNHHHSTLIRIFDKLLESGSLVDVTLAAGGITLNAHRVVLCACSSYLEEMLKNHEDKHPVLIFNDVSPVDLKSILEYMYKGEVNVKQDHLGPFLKAAEVLQIKGLTGSINETREILAAKELAAGINRSDNESERPPTPQTPGGRVRKRRRISKEDDSNSCETIVSQSLPATPTAPQPTQASTSRNNVTKVDEKVIKKGLTTDAAPCNITPKVEYFGEDSNQDETQSIEDEDEYSQAGSSQAMFFGQSFNNSWGNDSAADGEASVGSQSEASLAPNAQAYNCSVCSYSSKWKQNVKKHFNEKHNPDCTLYPCQLCSYVAKRRNMLKLHLNRHTMRKNNIII